MPKQFTLEISNVCKAKCYLCEKRSSKNPETEDLIKMIIKMKDLGMERIRLTGGEPILANDFPRIVKILKDLGVFIEITTTLLSDDKEVINALLSVDKIRISLSGVGKFYKDYFSIDNSNFNLVDQNIKTLLKNEKHIEIHYLLSVLTCDEDRYLEFNNYLNYLVKKFNRDDLFEVKYTKEIGIKSIENPEDVLIQYGGNSKFKSNIEFAMNRYKDEKEIELPEKCYVHNFHMYVRTNGDVYPCCITGGEVQKEGYKQVYCGNLLNDNILNFKEIYTPKNGPCSQCFNKYKNINVDLGNLIKNKIELVNY